MKKLQFDLSVFEDFKNFALELRKAKEETEKLQK